MFFGFNALAVNKLELACGSYKNKSFPFTVIVRQKNNKHFMTLARGKKVLLRTPAKKLALHNGEYETQFSSGPNFNLSLDSDGHSGTGYLRAKYLNRDGSNLVAGTLACRKI